MTVLIGICIAGEGRSGHNSDVAFLDMVAADLGNHLVALRPAERKRAIAVAAFNFSGFRDACAKTDGLEDAINDFHRARPLLHQAPPPSTCGDHVKFCG